MILVVTDFTLTTNGVIFVTDGVAITIEFCFHPTILGVLSAAISTSVEITGGLVGIEYLCPIDGINGSIRCNGGNQCLDLVGGIIGIDGFRQSPHDIVFVVSHVAIPVYAGSLSPSFIVDGNGAGIVGGVVVVVGIDGFYELPFLVVAVLGGLSVGDAGDLIAVVVVFVNE